MDKTIRLIKGPEDIARQQKETYAYWASVTPGDRLSAVCELSMDAYRFKGIRFDVPRPQRTLIRVERPQR